ncbi:Lrp/AsnC family transcriptional regulator [soil metagenome]
MSGSPAGAPSPGGQTAIDDIDRLVVAELQADGRLSMRALADRVHVSRASAYTRVQRLRAAEVITGFAATVDPQRLGLGTSAHVAVTIEQNSWRDVATALRRLPGVERVTLVGADFDVLVLVRARDNHELRDLVLERIQAVPAVKATRTWLIFDEIEGT